MMEIDYTERIRVREEELRASGEDYYTDEETGHIYPFYKKHEKDKVWWLDRFGAKTGVFFFTFDKKKMYSIFGGPPENDPRNMSEEEKRIFVKEFPSYEKFVR